MRFKLACGHTVALRPFESFFSVIARHPKDKVGRAVCMRCHLESKERARD
jgi:hypothetical protein